MPSVILQRHGAVLEIVLNRAELLSAANCELIASLAEAAEDRAACAVPLRGAGTYFCAGGDITMFSELDDASDAAAESPDPRAYQGAASSTPGDAFDAQLTSETESFAACATTEEFGEGVRGFLDKRRPAFSYLE
jgi:enoyl-CoA hydratase/carnithine racemase